MQTSPESPSKKPMILLASQSPRSNTNKSRLPYGNESPQQSNLPLIPTSMAGRVKLFGELASPQHKQLNDKLSFKNLSSSLADIRAGMDTKESTPTSQSPKKGKDARMNITPVQEYYAKTSNPRLITGDESPKKFGNKKPKVNAQLKNAPGNKVRTNRQVPTSLPETRSLSPVPSMNILPLRDEIKGDYDIKYPDSPSKINFKVQKTSLYQKDFIAHTVPDKDFIIKNELYTQPHSHLAVSLGTTMKEAFKPWESKYNRREGPKDTLVAENNTFLGKSNYQSEYLNFASHRALIERSPHHKTVLTDLAFEGKSSYRDIYSDNGEPREFVSRWFDTRKKSPFPGAIHVPNTTTYSTTFKPFKVGSSVGSDEHLSTQSILSKGF